MTLKYVLIGNPTHYSETSRNKVTNTGVFDTLEEAKLNNEFTAGWSYVFGVEQDFINNYAPLTGFWYSLDKNNLVDVIPPVWDGDVIIEDGLITNGGLLKYESLATAKTGVETSNRAQLLANYHAEDADYNEIVSPQKLQTLQDNLVLRQGISSGNQPMPELLLLTNSGTVKAYKTIAQVLDQMVAIAIHKNEVSDKDIANWKGIEGADTQEELGNLQLDTYVSPLIMHWVDE